MGWDGHTHPRVAKMGIERIRSPPGSLSFLFGNYMGQKLPAEIAVHIYRNKTNLNPEANMAADFNTVCWLLDHDFQFVNIEGRQYYVYAHYHKTIYVRNVDPTEPKDDYRDQYVCFINKTAAHNEIVVNSAINFSSKDWIIATGIHPKRAIRSAINKSLDHPEVKGKDELRSFGLTLNPVIWFLHDVIAYITKKF